MKIWIFNAITPDILSDPRTRLAAQPRLVLVAFGRKAIHGAARAPRIAEDLGIGGIGGGLKAMGNSGEMGKTYIHNYIYYMSYVCTIYLYIHMCIYIYMYMYYIRIYIYIMI